jgi:hypothetical protein
MPEEQFDPEQERPIPVEDLDGESWSPAGVFEEAEGVVRAAQDDLARQSTDPYMTLPDFGGTSTRGPNRLQRSLSRRVLVGLSVVTVLVAFGHGWHVGSLVADTAASCDVPHCRDLTED